jgi:hypothetical protein
VYNAGESITGRAPRPMPPAIPLGRPIWRFEANNASAMKRTWQVGSALLHLDTTKGRLVAIDMPSGKVRFAAKLDRTARSRPATPWVNPGASAGEVLLSRGDLVQTVDLADGTVRGELDWGRDRRIEPVAVGTDLVLATGYRSETFTRVDSDGKVLWTCRLKGYVMRHPARAGDVLVVQTRQGSYGGQRTSGIDLGTGNVRWSDVVNAYGTGVAVFADGRMCVEGDNNLSPKRTEGRLTARQPRTGKVLWRFTQAGTMLQHAPVIDLETDRTYVVLDDGAVVCVGPDGAKLWQTDLPRKPVPAPAASYDPYRPGMRLSGRWVAVIDNGGTVHLLDKGTGRHVGRIAVGQEIIRHGKWAGTTPLPACPWLVGDVLVVPTRTHLAGYRLNGGD